MGLGTVMVLCSEYCSWDVMLYGGPYSAVGVLCSSWRFAGKGALRCEVLSGWPFMAGGALQ